MTTILYNLFVFKASVFTQNFTGGEKMDNTVMTNNESHSKTYQWFLIFLCFFIYFTAQLGRYSYTSNINLFEKTAGVTYTEAGLVSTLYFLTYGAGQIVNGLLCKRYNKRVMCLIAVLLSSAINFLVFLGVPFNSLYALWALNAAAQSILYPSVMLTISENVEKKYLAAASIVMSCATTVGTFASYGISALFSKPENFKYSFVISAATMIFAGIAWVAGSLKMRKTSVATVAPTVKTEKTEPIGASKLGVIALGELAFFAFVSYAIGGGIGTWTPTIMLNLYDLGEGFSAFLAAFLPFFSIFNSVLSELVYVWCKSFNKSSLVLFGGTAVLSVATIFLINTHWAILFIMLILIRLFSGAATNLYTSKAPLYLADRANAGFLSGFLNGLCYLGNAVSSFALGLIADEQNWTLIFVVFAVGSALTMLCYPFYAAVVKKNPKKTL